MDIVETQKMFKEMYPDTLVKFDLDEKCLRKCECIMTEGLPNLHHHLEFEKVRVIVENILDRYVPITTHRVTTNWAEFKKIVSSKNEVYLHPETKKVFKELSIDSEKKVEYEQAIQDFSSLSGMTKEQIEASLT